MAQFTCFQRAPPGLARKASVLVLESYRTIPARTLHVPSAHILRSTRGLASQPTVARFAEGSSAPPTTLLRRLFRTEPEPAPESYGWLRRPTVVGIIVINVLVWGAWSKSAADVQRAKQDAELKSGEMMDGTTATEMVLDGRIEATWFAFCHENLVASYDNLHAGRWHTLVTSVFSHVLPAHLVGNMLLLPFFLRAAFVALRHPAPVFLVAGGSGILGNFGQLYIHEEWADKEQDERRGVQGASCMVFGLAAAAAAARPRMPFYFGLTPRVVPMWVLPALLVCRDVLTPQIKSLWGAVLKLNETQQLEHVAAVKKRAAAIKAEGGGKEVPMTHGFCEEEGESPARKDTTSAGQKSKGSQATGPRVGHNGHLIGAVFGAVIGLFLRRRR